MKRIKLILVLLILFIIILSNTVIASFQKVTMDDIKNYFYKTEEQSIENIEIQDNKIIIKSKDNQIIELYYNSDENIFYIEEKFDSLMTYDTILKKIKYLAVTPFYGFFSVAEKNKINSDIYNQYAAENGYLEACMLSLMIDQKIKNNNIENIDNFFNEEFFNEMNKNYQLYSIKYTKEKIEDKIIIKNALTINSTADFSKISDYLKDKTAFLTEENAEFSIKIKVGEVYKFKIDKEITGYSLTGNRADNGEDIIEFSEDYNEITALNVGVVKGYICIDEEYKSIYISVIENNSDNFNNKNENKVIDKNNNSSQANLVKFPNSGLETNIWIPILSSLIGMLLISLLIMIKKINKINKD